MAHDMCVDVVVGGSGWLNADQLTQHLRPSSNESVQLDLRRLTFIEPAGLVSLAAVAERAALLGRQIRFSPPTSEDVANYLARMRLGDHLNRLGVSHRLPTVREHRLGPRVVELRRFDGVEGIDNLIKALVQTYLDDRPNLVQPIYAALDEIAKNVVEHSGRPHGYLALQRFDRANDVAFAVADSGIGLRARLTKTVNVPDDRVAIVRAAQTHVTTTDQPGRGRGIGRVIDITGAHYGEVTLISGGAQGVFRRGSPDTQLSNLLSPHPGTLANVRLSL